MLSIWQGRGLLNYACIPKRSHLLVLQGIRISALTKVQGTTRLLHGSHPREQECSGNPGFCSEVRAAHILALTRWPGPMEPAPISTVRRIMMRSLARPCTVTWATNREILLTQFPSASLYSVPFT